MKKELENEESGEIILESNNVAVAIKVIALVLLVSGVMGAAILSGIQGSFLTFLCISAGFVVSFVFTYALGEVIQILHDIRSKLYSDGKVGQYSVR